MIVFRTSRGPDGAGGSDASGYDRIYDSRPIREIDGYYIWALSLLQPRPGQTLLDISCGIGRVVDIASRAKVRAVGLDISLTALRRARAVSPKGSYVLGDAENLPFDDRSFDFVINLGSLEHYPSPEKGASEISRILKPGGRAVVLVPNTFALLHVLYAWRRGEIFDDGQPLQRYGTYSDWRHLLEQNQLRVVRTVKYQRVWPRRLTDAWWYLFHPTKLLQALLTPLLPFYAASCFAFVCEPSEINRSPA